MAPAGRPVPAGLQLAPSSLDWYTPAPVLLLTTPAKSSVPLTVSESTVGSAGSPLAGVHASPSLVLRQIPAPELAATAATSALPFEASATTSAFAGRPP